MIFPNAKKTFLAKPDKSQAGEIDEAILPLVHLINSRKNYYTTSSCSGRIILLKQDTPKGQTTKKHETRHFFVSHDPITLETFFKACSSLPPEAIMFHMEGMILHVCCSTLPDAERLLTLARDAGFKRSGISSISNNSKKVIVEIIDTQRLELPLAMEGRLLVSEDYLDCLIREANKKLQETRKKMEKLAKACEALP